MAPFAFHNLIDPFLQLLNDSSSLLRIFGLHSSLLLLFNKLLGLVHGSLVPQALACVLLVLFNQLVSFKALEFKAWGLNGHFLHFVHVLLVSVVLSLAQQSILVGLLLGSFSVLVHLLGMFAFLGVINSFASVIYSPLCSFHFIAALLFLKEPIELVFVLLH